jgi:thiol-disulfide isomerase/thioredoxin
VDVTLLRAAALLAVLALAGALGLLRRSRDGRTRSVDASGAVTGLRPEQFGAELGARATLLQFSSPYCSPCRTARRLLAGLAADLEGVAHVELDATEHLDLVRDLDVRRTPTVLVLDARGRVRSRAVGVPTRHDLVAALDGLAAGALHG